MSDTTAFFQLIHDGNAEAVRAMLKGDPELANATDQNDLTPVMFARYFEQEDVLRVLMEEGVKLSLHEAAATGNPQRVSLLLTMDPEQLNTFSPDGFTALQLACYFGEGPVVHTLLERGADVNETSVNQMRLQAIHSAAASGEHAASVGVMEQLLDAGADIDARQHGGFTPLHAAAQNGNEPLVRLLIARGASRISATDDGRTAGDFARQAGHTGIAAMLH